MNEGSRRYSSELKRDWNESGLGESPGYCWSDWRVCLERKWGL